MERWQAEGQPNVKCVLREKTQTLLAELSAPDGYDELIKVGEKFIIKRV